MSQTMAWKARKNISAMENNGNIRYVDKYKRLKKCYKILQKPIIYLKQK